jgi:hypothetical protein
VAGAVRRLALGCSLIAASAACGSSATTSPTADGSRPDAATASGPGDAGSTIAEAGDRQDSGTPAFEDDGGEAEAPSADGASPASLAADRFVTNVVSFTPGECAGFMGRPLPQVVEGPPVGGGSDHGSIDVVSLGSGGTIVVSFGDNAIVDGPGPDFIVFENPFWVAGDSTDVFAEPGEVSVSDDGVTWQVFPCSPAPDPQSSTGTGAAPPYGACAGWHVVWSNPTNGISPVDPAVAGGDAFDLADLGVTHARYVRIVDETHEACPEAGGRPDNDGFDLDAVAIVHAERP